MESVVIRGSYHVSYQDEYVTSILMRQLDELDNVKYEIELLEAFPRNMNLMELNNSSQNQTHRLTVLFAYRYWKRTDIPQNIQTRDVRPRVNFESRPIVPPKTFSWTENIGTAIESLGGSSLPPVP
jgi:hypothetical protein